MILQFRVQLRILLRNRFDSSLSRAKVIRVSNRYKIALKLTNQKRLAIIKGNRHLGINEADFDNLKSF